MEVLKTSFRTDWTKMRPKGLSLTTSFWTKPFCSKPTSASSGLYGGLEKLAVEPTGLKCVPRPSPNNTLLDEAILFKLTSASSGLHGGPDKLALGPVGLKCVPRASP